MKTRLFSLTVALCMPLAGYSQQVPAIQPMNAQAPVQSPVMAAYPPINLLSSQEVSLNSKEQQAVKLANQWKARPEMPTMGADGTLHFTYGQTLPSIICAPLYACDVSLEPGEIVTQVDVGDSVRWKVTPAISGNGNQSVTHLIIKPTDAGLTSNMIVSTDRRSYTIKLVSRKDMWTPKMAFTYPEDVQSQWATYTAKTEQVRNAVNFMTVANTNSFDYGFNLKGDSPVWKPVRVFTDQTKTYIQFPPSIKNTETPALVVIGPDAKDQLVNYRMLGNQYVVDKVIQKAALISGVGRHQERVEIAKEGAH